jgi:(1->4)-alpha-D-glucan 1-alpha-D-glucosylmutase
VSRILSHWEDGLIKLFVTAQSLRCRGLHPDLFIRGDYIALRASGEKAGHVVAFSRRLGDTWAVVAAARFFALLAPSGDPPLGEATWGDGLLTLPQGAPSRWVDGLTGEIMEAGEMGEGQFLSLATLFQHLPVALLVGQ